MHKCYQQEKWENKPKVLVIGLDGEGFDILNPETSDRCRAAKRVEGWLLILMPLEGMIAKDKPPSGNRYCRG